MPTTPPPSTVTHCLECQAPLSRAEAQGLCARCLLKMGLASQFGESSISLAGARKLVPPPLFPFDFGGYHVLRMLGRGGMGVVYEADEVSTGRRVALKVLGQALDSQENRQRFLREGRLAASINHPNSVYVFGTEEIDGTPIIAMELVAGGTLAERVKAQGPLPVSAAVDAILQMIPGLEAAHAVGILHRDIKPSNCFLDARGEVKIGDFGLSISTLSRGDSELTMAGCLLGTPDYASPEQLRGEALDVRSDIYAVGMTLYFLLTGRTAFQADNLVQLLSTVFDKPAPSPRNFRSEVPARLARIVERCLAKEPGDRFRNYPDLSAALLPFASSAPSPATVGLRFIAGGVDHLLFIAINMVATKLLVGDLGSLLNEANLRQPKWIWLSVGLLCGQLAYFAIGEGRWGATLGKTLVGLRVCDRHRNVPGMARALARAAIFLLPAVIFLFFIQSDLSSPQWTRWHIVRSLLSTSWPVFLMVTVRQRNGYATVVDLLTRTRVVQRTASEAREPIAAAEEPVASGETTRKIGPYHVLSTLAKDEESELLLGYDARLLRRVWIRLVDGSTPPLSAEVRHAARPGQLRWLQGRRTGGEAWDAFEAPPGTPLVALLSQPEPWMNVRFWLLDLAVECAAERSVDAPPKALSMDRVWITAANRAKILDFRAPGTATCTEEISSADTGAFLRLVALSCLEGWVVPAAEAHSGTLKVPVAVRARQFLHSLCASSNLDSVVQQLRELSRQVPVITGLRRLMMVAGCTVPALLLSFLMMVGVAGFESWKRRNPELMPLKTALQQDMQMREGKSASPKVTAAAGLKPLEIYIAGRYGKQIAEQVAARSSIYTVKLLTEDEKSRAAEIVALHGQPTPEAMIEARAAVGDLVDIQEKVTARMSNSSRQDGMMFYGPFLGSFVWATVLSIGAAGICRGGVLMRALGVAVVTRHGADASRLRMCWRACVAWCWFPIFAYVEIKLAPGFGVGAVLAGGALLVSFLAIWSAINPGRTIQDRLAGTWLVPR